MKKLNKTIVILAMLISMTLVSMITNAEVIKEVAKTNTYLTTAYGYQGTVNLYSIPQGYGISTSAIDKIPNGTNLLVLEKETALSLQSRTTRVYVTWFKVSYRGKVGWISQYSTSDH